MKILVINCGSSSLKYQLFDMENEAVLAKGLVEQIGLEGANITHRWNGQKKQICTAIPNHSKAIALVIECLTSPECGVIKDMKEIDAVGHRTIHGGSTFVESVLINEEVENKIDELAVLAPLHNPPSLVGIRACKENIPGVPMVGVFDTAFHQSMPASSYIYAMPYEYYEKHSLRRYGFHGTSHRFVVKEVPALVGKPLEELKIINCHLGNGSSLCAVSGGKVVDTTMGLTPLGGLVMGTRCGDIDPAIITFLMEKENLDIAGMDKVMNKKSGLLGISGVSSDMREVEKAANEGNERAQLALDSFVRSVVHFIGAYVAEMNGVDVITFTAGIGENSASMREKICSYLTYLGLEFDSEANNCRGEVKEITKAGSKVRAFIVPTNEELMIARDTRDIVLYGKVK